MENLINRFFTFANGSYTMFAAKSKVKDGRKSPQIEPSVVFLSLILMVLLKKRSFLKLDQFMRTDAARRFLGRDSRRLVAVSDSTIARSLSTYSLAPLRRYLRSVYINANRVGWNLLLLFNLEDIRKGYEHVKWTLDFLSELLLMWFYVEYHALS